MNRMLLGGLCLATGAIILTILIIVGETVIPTAFMDGVYSKLVMDSQAEVDEWISEDDGWRNNNSITFVFFNLTNAKAMQTTTPAPKPAFEAVAIECIESFQKFDGTSTARSGLCAILDTRVPKLTTLSTIPHPGRWERV